MFQSLSKQRIPDKDNPKHYGDNRIKINPIIQNPIIQTKPICPCGGGCPGCMQAKLKVSQPDDLYEQEADRVAEQVMRMPSDKVSRKCSSCEMKDKKDMRISRKASRSGFEIYDDIANDISSMNGGGSSLDTSMRSFMESRFGFDFSKVRIHTDERADSSAELVNARAYTIGRDIIFGQNQYNPITEDGKKLLAHELTHVIQQQNDSDSIIQRDDRVNEAIRKSAREREIALAKGIEDDGFTIIADTDEDVRRYLEIPENEPCADVLGRKGNRFIIGEGKGSDPYEFVHHQGPNTYKHLQKKVQGAHVQFRTQIKPESDLNSLGSGFSAPNRMLLDNRGKPVRIEGEVVHILGGTTKSSVSKPTVPPVETPPTKPTVKPTTPTVKPTTPTVKPTTPTVKPTTPTVEPSPVKPTAPKSRLTGVTEFEGQISPGKPLKGMGLETEPSMGLRLGLNIGAQVVTMLLTSWMHDALLESIKNMPPPTIKEAHIWSKEGVENRTKLDLLGSHLAEITEQFEKDRGNMFFTVFNIWASLDKMSSAKKIQTLNDFEASVMEDNTKLTLALNNVRDALKLESSIKESIKAAVNLQEFAESGFGIQLMFHSGMSVEEIANISSTLSWYQASYQRGVLEPLRRLENDLQKQIKVDHNLLTQIQTARSKISH